MANRFARANGDFNDASIWSTTAGGAGGASVPTIGDNAIANTFTVQITGTVQSDNLTNGNYYGGTAGGTFNLNNNAVVIGNCRGGASGASTSAFTLSGTNNAAIIGSIQGTTNTDGGNGVLCTGIGLLTVTGIVRGGTATGTNVGNGIRITNQASVMITGNLEGGTGAVISAAGINCSSNANITIVGNLIPNTAAIALYNTGTSTINIIGNVLSSNSAGLNSTLSNIKISGNILNAANGTQAIYAPSYRIDPIPQNGYIRYARNGTGVGSDAWLYQFTTDSLSAFSMPPVSAVRFGTTFANATLTGTCVIPSPSSVAFGVPVDDTTGQAVFTTNTFFDLPLSAINTPDSIGARIKNAATIESAGHLLASFTTN